ncbi:hypothetical protein Y032_0222g2604 [Ancylostoma ceylanicum]|uniref:GIY-YIG domain-containing protein n=1 Tax=Ancylostoma ceylanicum TaxID=53326 RepID=A0A016SHW0_9BILA|nr:hypothetical protein Y032_0222g2604 [Ancylostoma ceylanicum]
MPDCVICTKVKQGDCMSAAVVYLITCKKCGEEYICETARPLCTRMKEHLHARAKPRLSNALDSHRLNCQEEVDFEIKATILVYKSQLSARKTLKPLQVNITAPNTAKRNTLLSHKD